MSKQKKLKPELATGFRDRKGNELILKDRLIEIIKRNFQLYGFEPLETPGFEISENIGKFLPDENRPMSGVFGFKDENDWISLRYDLTAPLARYVSENFDNLSKPFKRYQVGTVWRNEKSGPGRYREFTQIDADTVGAKNFSADADMCVLLADTLSKCGLNKNEYLIRISNRKLIQGLLEDLKITNVSKKLTVIRAAVEEGVVVGGGCALLYASQDLDKVKFKGADQKSGIDLIKKALQSPIRQIVANAGVDGSVVVGKLLEGKKSSQGYDAQNEEYCDMFVKGIIDPTKVVRTALQDAASVAGLLITTEAMVADKPEEKDSGPAMPPGGMGGGMGGMGGMGM